MKSEKGSALLTVILIVFVTATIGSAISSFVMMNYKLRNLDNRISRAEYEAEKSIDDIFVLIQECVNTTLAESRNNAISDVASSVKEELSTAEEALSAGNYSWNGEYFYIQDGIIESEQLRIEVAEETLYKTYFKNDMYNNIYNKLNKECEAKLISISDEFGKSSSEKEIKIKDKTDDETDIITIELKLYCEIVSSPPIQFSVDFVISMPTLEKVRMNNYNLNEIINMTNWEMQDWGYL